MSTTSSLPSWPIVSATDKKGSGGAGDNLLALPGFSSVPLKLVKRIVERQYVDMWELLPEMWQIETESTCCHSKRPRCTLVTDI